MYYKTLTANHCGPYSEFDYSPYLPTKNDDGTWTPGEWLPDVDELAICESGYHVTDADHLVEWLSDAIYEVEVSGNGLNDGDKSAHQTIRFVRQLEAWNETTARLFACWCVRNTPLADEQRTVWDAADAARNAIRNAARNAQTKRLLEVLGISGNGETRSETNIPL